MRQELIITTAVRLSPNNLNQQLEVINAFKTALVHDFPERANRVTVSINNTEQEVADAASKLLIEKGISVRNYYQEKINPAKVYLKGLQDASIISGNNYIVQPDSGGSHSPSDVNKIFNRMIKSPNIDAVFADRTNGYGYPWYRWLTSFGGTALANSVLSVRPHIPDFTSGCMGFRSKTIARLFEATQADNWISVRDDRSWRGLQTEYIARVLTLSPQPIVETQPINYSGRLIPPPPVPLKDIFQSLEMLFDLKTELNKQGKLPIYRKTK